MKKAKAYSSVRFMLPLPLPLLLLLLLLLTAVGPDIVPMR